MSANQGAQSNSSNSCPTRAPKEKQSAVSTMDINRLSLSQSSRTEDPISWGYFSTVPVVGSQMHGEGTCVRPIISELNFFGYG